MVYVGTSGYSYDDWVGRFYPTGTPKERFLEYYAHSFPCVEVNFTYYRMPTARTLAAMAAKTGPGFRFVVKMPGELTHERSGRTEAWGEFQTALQPLIRERKLGGVLAQFPYAFRPHEDSYGYLRELSERMGDTPTVVEFRNAAWVNPDTFDLLRRLGLGFCCVDEPPLRGLMPPVAEVTSHLGYVRFHGRNRAKWFEHQEAWERYDYLYTRQELESWVGRIRKIAAAARETYVFFNNHYNAQAVHNASLFTEILKEAGIA